MAKATQGAPGDCTRGFDPNGVAQTPDRDALAVAPSPDLADTLDRICSTLAALKASVGGPPPRPWYTVADVARLTGRGSDTVRRWIGDGRLAATRVAGTGPKGKLLIRHEELERLLGVGRRVAETAEEEVGCGVR